MIDRGSIAPDALVLDVGGWAAVFPRADWVLDAMPYATRNWFYAQRGEVPPECRVTADCWVQQDACELPWPFPDRFFDVVVCSQTLEDLRDPVGVCREMTRVGKSGRIEVPGPIVELTRGVESPFFCGWGHHRWLVERDEDGLAFIEKPHHIHSPLWPSVGSPKRWKAGAELLAFDWSGTFTAREEILRGQELDLRLLRIRERDAGREPARRVSRAALSFAWRVYRSARAAAGAGLRRGFG